MKKSEGVRRSDLKRIQGVGANMERHLNNIGSNCVEEVNGKEPDELYRLDSIKKGYRDDPCVLYVMAEK